MSGMMSPARRARDSAFLRNIHHPSHFITKMNEIGTSRRQRPITDNKMKTIQTDFNREGKNDRTIANGVK